MPLYLLSNYIFLYLIKYLKSDLSVRHTLIMLVNVSIYPSSYKSFYLVLFIA